MPAAADAHETRATAPTTLFDAHALVVKELQHPVQLLQVFTEPEPGPLWDDTYGAPNLTPSGSALVRTVSDLLGAAAIALWDAFWDTPHEDKGCSAFLRRASDTVALCSAAVVACRRDYPLELTADNCKGPETSSVLRIVYERLEPLYREAVED